MTQNDSRTKAAACGAALQAACLLLLLASSATAKAQEFDLANVRQAVQEYFASLGTVEGRYYIRQTLKPRAPTVATAPRPEDIENEVRFAWDAQRSRRLLGQGRTGRFAAARDGRISARPVRAFGGASNVFITYAAQFPSGFDSPAERPHIYLINKGRLRPDHGPWHLVGESLVNGGAKDLPSFVAYTALRFEGEEEVEGAKCLRLSAEFRAARQVVWLDPAGDYLPRRIELTKGAASAPLVTIRVAKLQQVDAPVRRKTGGQFAGKRWFPKMGTIELHGATHVGSAIEIDELRVDRRLSIDAFQVPVDSLPAGVQVIEPLDPRKSMDRPTRYTGDRKDLFDAVAKQITAQEERLAALHKRSLAPGGSPITNDAKTELAPAKSSLLSALWPSLLLASALFTLFLVVATKNYYQSES